MLEITLNCPECGAPNSIPVEEEAAEFVCEVCGESSAISETLSELSKAGQDPLIGAVISECEIIEKVGEGGFGAVYKALDRNLQRPVALKILLQSLTSNQEFVQKFIREAITAAQLNHPHIVAIHKVGRDEQRGLHYLIMEFLEGRTLADLIEEEGKIALDKAVSIILQACEALAVAQEKKIIHRDIKPENLMVDGRWNVKITDFGLAKVVNPDMRSTKVVGTPHYMSPEQFEGKAIDGRTDIYSLGVTFYYMITREKPYQGTNTVQVIYSILTSEPRSPLEIDEGIPPELWSIIQRMIAKNPEDRYQTFQEVRADLLRFRDRALREGISCPRCSAENPEGRKFCRECGEALVVPCPRCGAEEPAGTKHCGQCGANVDSLRELGERASRASLLRSKGEVRKALRLYDEIVNIEPENSEAQEARAELSRVVEQIDDVREETSRLVDAGQYDDAIVRIEHALAEMPEERELARLKTELETRVTEKAVAAHRMVADEASARHDYAAAAEALRKALELDPDDPEVRLALRGAEAKAADLARALTTAREKFDEQQFDLAYAAAKEALQLAPENEVAADIHSRAKSFLDSTESFVERGEKLLGEGRYEDARLEFESALEVRPDDERVAALRDEAIARMEKFEAAVVEVRGLIERGDEEAAGRWIEQLRAERGFDPRMAELRAAVEAVAAERERAGELERLLQEGRQAEKAGDLERALETYEKVLEEAPSNARASELAERTRQRIADAEEFERLAQEHESEGNLPQAVAALNRLAELRRGDASVRERLTRCQKKLERLEKAIQKAERALQERRLDDARDHAVRVLELAPRSRRAERVKAEVDRLQGAIAKHLQEAEARIGSELFDDALASIEKASQLGAEADVVEQLRVRAEGGKIATLKADATRSFRFDNFEQAVKKYEQVLELSGGDAEAIAGRKKALRRLVASRRESPWIKLAATILLVVGLGAVQLVAVSLPPSKVRAAGLENDGTEPVEVVDVETGPKVPWEKVDLDELHRAARERRWDDVLARVAEEEKAFATDPSVEDSRRWVLDMRAAGELAPRERRDRLDEIRPPVAGSPLASVHDAVVAQWRTDTSAEITASIDFGNLQKVAEDGEWTALIGELETLAADPAADPKDRKGYQNALAFAKDLAEAEATPTAGNEAAVVAALDKIVAPPLGPFRGDVGRTIVVARLEHAAMPLVDRAESAEADGDSAQAALLLSRLSGALEHDRPALASLRARVRSGLRFNASFNRAMKVDPPAHLTYADAAEPLREAHQRFLDAYESAEATDVRRNERVTAVRRELGRIHASVAKMARTDKAAVVEAQESTRRDWFDSFALYRRLCNTAARAMNEATIGTEEAWKRIFAEEDGR